MIRTIKKYYSNIQPIPSSTTNYSHLKSCLFIPGNQEKMLQKILKINADIIVPDLEDSVPISEKIKARNLILSHIISPAVSATKKTIFPRLNSLQSGLFYEDLESLMILEIRNHIQGFVIPKINTAEEYDEINKQFTNLENKLDFVENSFKLIIWIESTRGMVNMQEIFKLNTNKRIIAAAFGAEDFCNDFEIDRSQNLEIPRYLFAMTAHAYGIIPLDTPNVEFKNENKLIEEIEMVKKLGFKGKFAIHPNQVDVINKYFSPSDREVIEARKIVDEYEKAEKFGRASLSVDDKMVDIPVYKRALNVLRRADNSKLN